MQKYIAHFSCGVPSAVAAWLAIREFGAENVRVVYCDTGSEHEDNKRFLSDVEAWIGVKVEVIKSEIFDSVDDVITETGWLAGVNGARCTGELKKIPAQEIISWGPGQEIEVFGYTIEEEHRVKAWKANNLERKMDAILIRNNLSKVDCQGLIEKANIKRPVMYDLGYQNNNCLGCVKGQAGYWNKIREDFPGVFARRAKQERALNATICKVEVRETKAGYNWPDWVKELSTFDDRTEKKGRGRVKLFLDELPENHGDYPSEPEVQCGLFCQLISE